MAVVSNTRHWNNHQSSLSLESLEQRSLLSGISIADVTVNEISGASAFVAAGSGGLSTPKDLTLGPDGNLYVASSGTNSVLRYNASTGQFLSTFVASGSGGLQTPYGVTFGPEGDLYVSSGSNSILHYNGSTGAFVNAFVAPGVGGLNSPTGLEFGSDGNLYVSSQGNNSVLRYAGPSAGVNAGSPLPATGQAGATFVAAGSGGLDTPKDLKFGPDGDLYVASVNSNAAVLRFDTTGNFIDSFVPTGRGGLNSPRGIAFGQDGRLYVADNGNGSIHRYDTQGQFVDDLVAGSAASGLLGITFDSQGALLISNGGTQSIARADRGVVLTLSAASATPITIAYTTADGTATGADYTTQTGTVTFQPGQTTRRILLATTDDLIVEPNETFTVQLSNAIGATIGNTSATVTIVDDDATRQVTITDTSTIEGDHTAHYRGAFVDDLSGTSFNPITFGPDGNLYTATGSGTGYNSIRRYNGTTGAFMDTFVPAGRINGVRDIVFRGGFMYVASTYTSEVLRYNASTGAFVDVFVTAKSGGIDNPDGMAFGPDANNDGVPELYVTGLISHSVVRYDGVTGQPLETFIAPGSGGLSYPFALAFGPDAVYVTSSGTNQVLKYNSLTGAYIGVAASAGLSQPCDVSFGADGLMYVTSMNNNRILRFTASGTYVDDYVPAGSGGMVSPRSFTFGPDGDLYLTTIGTHLDRNQVLRFGTESEAVFTVSLSTPSSLPITVGFNTADGTALAGSDYTANSGTLTFAPGKTTKTVLASTLDNTIPENDETFVVNLSNATGSVITESQGVGTITDDDATKFFVVNDASADQTYRYGAPGNSLGNSALTTGNTSPRGVASNAAGNTVWVADANRKVYIYNTSGGSLGSWTAGTLQSTAQVEGITTNGTDVWIVDNKTDKVFKYTAAAGLLSGSLNSSSSFALNSSNTNPKGIVTDGTSIWVINDSTTDKIFKYSLSGTLQGSWTIDAANSSPTGVTIDPTNVSNIWTVDSGTDKVYQYTAAASRTSGSQTAAATFALAPGNTNPQDIADPPVPGSQLTTETSIVSAPAAGSASSAIFASSGLSVPVSLPKTFTTELGGQDTSLSVLVTTSNDGVDLNRLSFGLGQSKTSARRHLSPSLSQMDPLVTSDIASESSLDALFVDWSTDPLQLLLTAAR